MWTHASEAVFTTVDLALAMRHLGVNPFPMKWYPIFYGLGRSLGFHTTKIPEMDQIITSFKTRSLKPSLAVRILFLRPGVYFFAVIISILFLVVIPISIWRLAESRASRDNDHIQPASVGLLFVASTLWTVYAALFIVGLTFPSLWYLPFGGFQRRTFPPVVVLHAYLGCGIPSLAIVAALLSFPLGMCSERGSRSLFGELSGTSDMVLMDILFGIPLFFAAAAGGIIGPVYLFDFIMKWGTQARGRVLG